MGDPETQGYMVLLKTDLLEVFEACINGTLDDIALEWNQGFAVCVVMASGGYPSTKYKKGLPITGIEDAEAIPGVTVLHAGTKKVDGKIFTSGGRVLDVIGGVCPTLEEAIDLAYQGVRCIHFEDCHFRTDIGRESLLIG
jgi:phosphoribosylamine--glycine ligase